jgi:hypothetical protein
MESDPGSGSSAVVTARPATGVAGVESDAPVGAQKVASDPTFGMASK